jgi:Mce-associated membrane protein
MTRPTPRRVTSRGVTPRPRKLAGQTSSDTATSTDAETTETTDTAGTVEEDAPERVEERGAAAPPEPPGEDVDGHGPPPVLSSPGVTRMLLIILTVLAVLLVLQGAWFARHKWLVDAPPEKSTATGAIAVPPEHPVVEGELAWKEAADVAARATKAMLTRSWRTYDKDVDAATALMTDDWATKFRGTTDDVKSEFVKDKGEMSVEIQSQAVVRANDAEAQVLVFFDESTTTSAGANPHTVKSGYRALVTVVHTDQGWFVDNVDAK